MGAEIVAALLAKNRVRASARAILTVTAVFEHFAEQAVVFFHLRDIAVHAADANFVVPSSPLKWNRNLPSPETAGGYNGG
jgi:hypothetical protein